ncbi:MAG: family 16 glycosylhydrolase, partial [Nitrospinota bacterium]
MRRNSSQILSQVFLAIVFSLVVVSCVVDSGIDGSNERDDSILEDTGRTLTEYVLVWNDEFNGESLDTSNWNIETGYGPNSDGWGNDESQLYTNSESNLKIIEDPKNEENSFLSITARCDSGFCGLRDGSITSAKVNTKDKFEFKYGKIEARIKTPNGKSTWPAFWMLGADFPDTKWPKSGEIDIMELHQFYSNNKTTHFTLHWDNANSDSEHVEHVYDSRYKEFDKPITGEFHIFEAEWDENQITGKIDGITYYTKIIDHETMDELTKDFFLILNIAIDGTLGGPPDAIKTEPQEMLVDWVRVYQKPKPQTVSLISDDEDIGSDTLKYVRIVNSVEYGGNSVVTDITSRAITPIDGSNVMELNYQNANAYFSGAAFEYNSADISSYNTLTFGINTSKFANFDDLSVEFVDSRNKGDAIGKKSVQLSNYSGNSRSYGWKIYKIPLADFVGVNLDAITLFGFWNPMDASNKLISGLLYIDDITLTTDSSTGGGGRVAASPTVAATSPTLASTDVISVFSDGYTSVAGVNYNPTWGQATVTTVESIEDNEVLKLAGLDYQGIDWIVDGARDSAWACRHRQRIRTQLRER